MHRRCKQLYPSLDAEDDPFPQLEKRLELATAYRFNGVLYNLALIGEEMKKKRTAQLSLSRNRVKVALFLSDAFDKIDAI